LDPDAKDEELLYGDADSEVGVVRSAAEPPELRRCISLDPNLYLRSRTAEALFNSPHLTGLRRLSAYGDAGDVFEDLDSPTFSNLRYLNLYGNDDLDHHPPDIDRLVFSSHLANLEYLSLGHCNLWDGNLRSLATTTQLPRLCCLDISGGNFGFALEDFFRTKSLPALTELDLSDSLGRITEARPELQGCIKLIANSPLIERLTKLALRRNWITDEEAMALANSPRKLQLTQLDLWCNQITTTAKRALEKRFGKGVCKYKQPADRFRR
jgi:hypothetical protein